MQLLSKSLKTVKSDKAGLGYLSAIMYLAPWKVSGRNVCPNASAGCIAACLNTSGRGVYQRVQQARIRRTDLYFDKRPEFMALLRKDIEAFVRKCNRERLIPAVRLNGTSDIPWERIAPELFILYPQVQFYDYTKSLKRMLQFVCKELPSNYHLTFSRSEVNDVDTIRVLEGGGSVAVVFSTKALPKKWKGFKVFNADETDLRFLDKPGVQGLYAKGRARRDMSGFVVKL